MEQEVAGGGIAWLPILVVVVGLVLVVGAVLVWRHGKARHAAAATWIRGEAIIDTADIDAHRGMDHGDRTTWRPSIAYRYYDAQGVERHGTRPFLTLKADWNTRAPAEEWLRRHQPGSVVPVWFDPYRPDDATLELNPPSALLSGIFGCVGLMFVVIGGALTFFIMTF